MLQSREREIMTIRNYEIASGLYCAYLFSEKTRWVEANVSCSKGMSKFVSAGLDFVFIETDLKALTLHSLYSNLYRFRLSKIKELFSRLQAVSDTAVLGQSSALAISDRKVALSGYRADVDICMAKGEAEAARTAVGSLGYKYMFLKTDYSGFVERADNSFEQPAYKSYEGTIFTPLDLDSYSVEDLENIKKIQNVHLPIVNVAGCTGHILSVEFIYTYGELSSVNEVSRKTFVEQIPIQTKEENLANIFWRLQAYNRLGEMKPNIYLVACRALTMDIDFDLLYFYLRNNGAMSFFYDFVNFHYDIVERSTDELSVLRSRKPDPQALSTFNNFYKSLESYIQGSK